MSGGGAASRRKGLAGEREVAQAFEAAGWTWRGLEGSGDGLAVNEYLGQGLNAASTVHVEVKRYGSRARWPEWAAQASSEAPPGVPWLVVARGNRQDWQALGALDDLLRMLG